MQAEHLNWGVHTTVEKWADEADFATGAAPDEVQEIEGNLLLNAGITRLLNLLIAAGGQAFNNTNCRIGVGDTATAAAATDTDLAAPTNKYWMTMDATYPSVSAQTVTFKATYASGVANFAWAEWGIDAGTAANTGPVVAPMLNRKVASMGTKVSGATWVLTTTITVA